MYRSEKYEPGQEKILMISMSVVCFLLFSLFLGGCYNIYTVLIKRKKYQTLLILIFYIIAMLDIIFALGEASTIFIKDYCNILNATSTYMHSFTNLALGMCQCAILAELTIKLKILIRESEVQHDESYHRLDQTKGLER